MFLQEYLFVVISSFFVWVIVMYLLISSSVKSANRQLLYYEKMSYRSKLFELRKAGHSMADLSAIHAESDTHFWEWLTNTLPSADEKVRNED